MGELYSREAGAQYLDGERAFHWVAIESMATMASLMGSLTLAQ